MSDKWKEKRWYVFQRKRKAMIEEHCITDERGESVAGEDQLLVFKTQEDKVIFLTKHDELVAEYSRGGGV